jgi:urease accessory protein
MNILPRAAAVIREPNVRCSDTIALDYDARRKRRVVLTAKGGLRFVVDLEHAPEIRGGDAYRLEDGSSWSSRAATQGTWLDSPGTSATVICRPSFTRAPSAFAPITSSPRWHAGLGQRYARSKRPSIRNEAPTMNIESAAFYRLVTWLSPSFPVGAFSYSHGLEYLVESGAVDDEATLRAWVIDVLRYGAGRCDAILFAHAWRAREIAALRDIAELAAALAPSSERHLETTGQGDAFRDMVLRAWPTPTLAELQSVWDEPLAYPVAVAVAARDHAIPLDAALLAFLHAASANLISAGVRLIPLGQSAGQRITAAIEETLCAVVAEAQRTALEDLGSALLLTDVASMRHETQYTRLFRS